MTTLADVIVKRVIVESPYAGDVDLNERYARACMLDSLGRGEAPYLSHLLYTQVLDDRVDAERRLGINAGWAWLRAAQLVAVYNDLGTSPGMGRGVELALRLNIPTESRLLPPDDLERVREDNWPPCNCPRVPG